MRKRLFAGLTAVSLLASACAARSEPRTTTIVPPSTMVVGDTTDAAVEAAWWTLLNDPVLDGIVEEAIAANRDLRAAAARYTAARELAGAAARLQLPHGGPGIGVSRQHLSTSEAGSGASDRAASFIEVGVSAAWEADVFGRLRNSRRAADAAAGIAAMDVRGAQVAIVAEVAAAYFELRGAEQDRALLDALQARAREQLATTQALLAAGRVTRIDLLRTAQVDEELAAELSNALHRAERARNRLATLMGRPADEWRVPAGTPRPLRMSLVPIGTPAELLRRRPDVAAAEFAVAAAAARAGVARAELFPTVHVTGAIGLVAGSVGRLAETAAGSWLVAPRLIWNVFDWPRLRRELRAADALADAAFAEYEQTVLRALEDARTAIDAYAAANRAFAAHERRARAAEEAAAIVAIQYREGLVDSLARTVADRDAIAGALDANRALTAQRLTLVDVYRALGGGWR